MSRMSIFSHQESRSFSLWGEGWKHFQKKRSFVCKLTFTIIEFPTKKMMMIHHPIWEITSHCFHKAFAKAKVGWAWDSMALEKSILGCLQSQRGSVHYFIQEASLLVLCCHFRFKRSGCLLNQDFRTSQGLYSLLMYGQYDLLLKS